VPVHIGATQLKQVCFVTLLPLFIKWSKEAELTIDQVRLRQKDWLELVPMKDVEDVNVIAKKFFVQRGKNKMLVFHPGKGVELNLEIEHDLYLVVLARIERA